MHLPAAHAYIRFGVDGVNRVGAHLQRAGVTDVHPLLEIAPGGEVVVALLYRQIGGKRHYRIPRGEARAPLLIQRCQRAVPLSQPLAHGYQRLVREIEVPCRFQLRDAGLIPQAVEERSIGREERRRLQQTVMNLLQPIRVC